MKNIFLVACVLATLLFAACSGSETKAYDESLSPANATKPVTPLTIADTLLSDTATVRTPPVVMPSQTTTTTLSGNSSTAKAGLNPAHGQPGHRCDIAVGASLSTPVNTTAATPQVQSVTTNSSPAATTPSALSGSGGKLNPPHGQPGHDCAVEVGKPLKN